MGDVICAGGGTPAPTHIMETYAAISKGVIDGVFTPYETLRTFKFAEVAKYVTNTAFFGPSYPFYVVMNKKSYQKLPPDLKEIFDTLTGEYKERYALISMRRHYSGYFRSMRGAAQLRAELAAFKELEPLRQRLLELRETGLEGNPSVAA